jgi:hypothetical protein
MYLLVIMCHQIKNSVCHYTWKLIVRQYAKAYSNSTPKIYQLDYTECNLGEMRVWTKLQCNSRQV